MTTMSAAEVKWGQPDGLPVNAARLNVFFVSFLFRLLRQQPGMDIESVSAGAESGE